MPTTAIFVTISALSALCYVHISQALPMSEEADSGSFAAYAGSDLGDLASALNNLANRSLEAGLRERAGEYSLRSVTIYRRLAAEARAHFADQFARALCSRATILHDQGRQEESLEALQEGLGLFEDLARENQDRYQPQLGAAFINAAVFLAASGEFATALNTSEKSVAIFRELDARLAGVFQEQLAVALRTLSTQLRKMGRRPEAHGSAYEAVGIHEKLAASRPARYNAELAESLKVLAAAEDGPVAVETLKRALNLIRPLAREDPQAYEPDLSHILATMASSLSELNRSDEAFPLAKQAVFIDRRLAAAYPPFRFQLAQSLRALAVALTDLEQFDAALASIEESIQIRRELGATHRAGLARALDLRAKLQARLDLSAEALKSSREALEIMEALMPESPVTHGPGFAHALENHANRLLDSNDFNQALDSTVRSILLRRSLIAQNPRQQTIRLAMALGTMGRALGSLGRFWEARVCFAEGAKVLLPYMGGETSPMNLMGRLVQDYIDGRDEVCDPLPSPLTDEILIEQLFVEPPLSLDGYSRPEPPDDDPDSTYRYRRIIQKLGQALAESIARDPTFLDQVEWRDLERMLSEVFNSLGYAAQVTRAAKDGGKDIVLEWNYKGTPITWYVELKHWSKKRVGTGEMRHFVRVLVRDEIAKGILLSSGGFVPGSYEALSVIEQKRLALGGKDQIVSLCETYVKIRNRIWSAPETPLGLMLGSPRLRPKVQTQVNPYFN